MTSTIEQLNSGQAIIYSRSNIRRTFNEFDDTDISGICLVDNSLIVVYNDGSEREYDKEKIKATFKDFRSRCPDFFSYLGPDLKGPSFWRNNCYVLYKGWNYQFQGSYRLPQAIMQQRWGDKLDHIQNEEGMKKFLENPDYSFGYLVAPDGITYPNPPLTIDDSDEIAIEPDHSPYCSCGSFLQQKLALKEIQAEIPGYEPTCKHLTWIKRWRELLSKRSALFDTARGNMSQKATAWSYAPPREGEELGQFQVLYTTSGQMAPINKWKIYRKETRYNQYDAWSLFEAMLENEFIPFPAPALSQLTPFFKPKN